MKPSLVFEQATDVSGAAGQNNPVPEVRRDGKRLRLRAVAFTAGDGLLLVTVSIAATTVMHMIHGLGWNLVLTLICGMAIAMAVQILLAMAAAPILGSIESMVPSMIVAMVSPMAVCALDLAGTPLDPRRSIIVGARQLGAHT
jgi:hypothetical protein